MPLKFKYLKKDDVPAEHASIYVEQGGAFVLDVEGVVEKSKLDEFRQNNINLTNQLKSFEGIDAAKARELLAKQQELDEQNLIKKGDLTALIEAKINPLKADLERERQEKARLREQLDGSKLTDAVQSIGAKAGVRASAMPDLQYRASRAFKVVEGQVVPVDGGMNLDGWIEALKADAPHLFEQNSGGGASGNGSGGAGFNHGEKNPWKKETWNLTEQGRILRANPQLAKRLRAEAGR